MSKKEIAQNSANGMPVIMFHGDKGGVGKSWSCSVFADYLLAHQLPVALVDGDARNPDVSRMFSGSIPVINANLREKSGWMDLTDFMHDQQGKTVVISMPAGIGNEFEREAPRFLQTIEMMKRPLSMFWVINRLPDSINLLNEAQTVIGPYLKNKFVVKNLFFGDEDKFSRWDLSETRKQFEKSGGITIRMTELHERTVDKIYSDNDNIMPFSAAAVAIDAANTSPHGLTASENLELVLWLKENHKTFELLRPSLGI